MRKIILSVVAATVVLTTSSLAAEKVYATVNGTNITASDIAMVIRNPRIDFSKLPALTQKKVLNQAIDSKLLAKLAIKDGIEKLDVNILESSVGLVANNEVDVEDEVALIIQPNLYNHLKLKQDIYF